MLRPAKTLLVGTCAATALFATAASSQEAGSRIDNSQFSLGDVFAGQTLNVIDPAEGVSATTGANGSAASVQVEDEDVTLDSLQRTGNVSARTDVTVHGWSPSTQVTTAAVGQTLHTTTSGGRLTASTDQAVDGDPDGPAGAIEARTRVTAELSSSGDTSGLALAVGNDQASHVRGGSADIRTGQYHYGAGSTARTEASLLHVKGEAQLTAIAGANQASVEGATDDVRLDAAQVSTGSTEASVGAEVDNGQTVAAFSSAAANSVTLANQGASTTAAVAQEHLGYVRAESALYVGEFGRASANAAGVGNTVSAAVYGDTLTLDTDQLNSGGVDAYASFDGSTGYDLDVNASAYGNAVSAQACSDCDGVLDARNTQVNDGDVSAVTRADVGGARSVLANATAVGNQASYVVSRPRP
ncbi:MAG: holdfast anchor protein HfaD [Proteobacteria bacterium]|nr:holdfast anchor protein HfaD [Pseudomonadota bacterium]